MKIFMTVILLFWTSKEQTDASLPGIFLLPFMPLPKLAQHSSSAQATAASFPLPQNFAEHHQQNSIHQSQGFVKLQNVYEQSKQSSFSSTSENESDISGTPLQHFAITDARAAIHGPSQQQPPPLMRHQRMPLTFPPSASPPLQSIHPRAIFSPHHQQQPHLPQSSSQYTSSLQYSFQNGYSSGNRYESPASKKVVRHVSVFVAPPEVPFSARQKIHVQGQPEKHVNIIFIKGPDPNKNNVAEVNIPPVPEQKTLVYVLNKGQNPGDNVVVNTPAPPKYHPPDVFFIKYKDKKNNQQYGVPSLPPVLPHDVHQQQQQHYGSPPIMISPRNDDQQNGQPLEHLQQLYHTPGSPPQNQLYQTPPPQNQHYQTPPPQNQIYQAPPPPPPQNHVYPTQQHYPTHAPQQYSAPTPTVQPVYSTPPQPYDILLPPAPPTLQQHGASSNQNFNYTFPSSILSKLGTVSIDNNQVRLHPLNNVSQIAERRIGHDSEHDDHSVKYDISYHSLLSSEEKENKVEVDGKQLYGKSDIQPGSKRYSAKIFQNINSNFFQMSSEDKGNSTRNQDTPRKSERDLTKKFDPFSIHAIYTTKAKTSKLPSLFPSLVAGKVKYNAAGKVLAVNNSTGYNGFIAYGLEEHSRNVSFSENNHMKRDVSSHNQTRSINDHIVSNGEKRKNGNSENDEKKSISKGESLIGKVGTDDLDPYMYAPAIDYGYVLG